MRTLKIELQRARRRKERKVELRYSKATLDTFYKKELTISNARL